MVIWFSGGSLHGLLCMGFVAQRRGSEAMRFGQRRRRSWKCEVGAGSRERERWELGLRVMDGTDGYCYHLK